MNEIECPHCQALFQIEQSAYADIVKQVRDDQFTEELAQRQALADKEKAAAVEVAKANLLSQMTSTLAEKDKQLAALQHDLQAANNKTDLSVTQAVVEIEKERDALKVLPAA